VKIANRICVVFHELSLNNFYFCALFKSIALGPPELMIKNLN